MFVGVGASRVRDIFGQAKKNAPCIVFIDEIDAVGRHRGAGLGGGTTSASRRSTSFWSRWMALKPIEGVILVAATEPPDVLDPALLVRPALTARSSLPNPDISGQREDPQGAHAQHAAGADIDAKVIAAAHQVSPAPISAGL